MISLLRGRPVTRTVLGGLALLLAAVGALGFRNAQPKLPYIFTFYREPPGAWRPLTGDPADVATARFEGGALKIRLADNEDQHAYRGVKSTLPWDFTGQAWRVRTDLGRSQVERGVEVKFHVALDHDNDFVSMQFEDAGLRVISKGAGKAQERVFPFDPIQQHWLQIRHEPSDDTIRFETSPDGERWTQIAAEPRSFDITKVRAEIYAGTHLAVREAGLIEFSNFRRLKLG